MKRFAGRPLGVLVAGLALCAPGPALPQDCGERADVAVQVLGSGGPIADDGRASSGYLAWVGGASRALIDAGGGAFVRFGEAGARFEALDFIGLSHFHTDHSVDFPALLKSGYFSDRVRPLTVAGPGAGGPFPGLQTYLASLLNPDKGAYGYLSGYLNGSGGLVRLNIVEVPSGAEQPVTLDQVSEPEFEVDAMHVPHGIVPALAFRLRAADRVIVFATDQNGGNPGFADFARNADLLVMHMAIPQDAGEAARRLHATPDQIGRIAAAAEAKVLLLSHFMGRSLRTLDDNLARVRVEYGGPVLVAKDLGCYLPGSR
jgi:ribonuclease BN (tRNA processing enzyme)